ncbi:glutathione S-transferase family protein [Sneathiella sp.]|uniref:glutathione S-transferase family protein n=1 Tax=Sneathiella sp. TaxID=1964365 RepID=UPI00261804F0|nr:glutathione S-transferase family protein [Sneathiella sp.]MDF2367952.1 glutathione S-transferase family protein [Sneathiella sp.]
MSENVLVIGNKRYSSWSLRGWLAARLSGMEFEEVLVPLYRPGCHEKLKEVNPAAPPKVPSLKVGDAAVWDTLAICEFLAEQYPEAHLWPEATFTRAHARSVVAEMHSSFQALREHVPMDLSKKLSYAALPEDVEADIARIGEIWRECRSKYSGDGPYLFGKISLADVFFAPVLVRLYSHSVPLDDVCRGYFDTLWALPEFVEWRMAAAQEEWTITDY